MLRTDPLMPLFTMPDGSPCQMPCLFGIKAGETTLEDAIALVQTHSLTRNLRLFAGDFSDTSNDPQGRYYFSGENWSLLFMGQGGQAVAIQIYEAVQPGSYQPGLAYDQPIEALCLKSVPNTATITLPEITPELALMWHRTSFLQMVASLGTPQSISMPTVGGTRIWAGSRIETFYFDDRLVITHARDNYENPDLNHNFFSSICLYTSGSFNERFNTGFHGRVGAIVPWLGVYASIQDYNDWMIAHPAAEPVPVMP